MKRTFDIEYPMNNGIALTTIKAFNAAEAKRILKKMTGCLIKDMTIVSTGGCDFKAAND